MALKCINRNQADAEWLELYNEDCERVRHDYAKTAQSLLSATNLDYAHACVESLRKIEQDLIQLVYMRKTAIRLLELLPGAPIRLDCGLCVGERGETR